MRRLVKIFNNKYVQIEEYKNPNICFNTNEYDNFEDYCTLRETFDPFEIFYENQELKKQLEERPKEYVFIGNAQNKTRDFINQITKDNKEFKNQQKKFIEYLENEIKERKIQILGYHPTTQLLIEQIIETEKKVLSKYKEIIEEDKKIEKLDVALLSQCDNWLRCPTNDVTKQDIELNPKWHKVAVDRLNNIDANGQMSLFTM